MNLILTLFGAAWFIHALPQPHPPTASLDLCWPASMDPAIATYCVYWGDFSRAYTNRLFIGPVTTYTLNNLLVGQTYFIAVTAVDGLSGIESDFSNEVEALVTTPPPRPVIVSASVLIESSPDLIHWRLETNIVWLALTNPADNKFFRAKSGVSISTDIQAH